MRTNESARVVERISALRRSVAAIERRGPADAPGIFTLGHDAIDARLGDGAQGGLARGRLHEAFAATPDDASAVCGFALMLAVRAAPPDATILWLRLDAAERRGGRIDAMGLAAIGLDPDRIVLGLAPDEKALLRASGDAVRCTGVGAVVMEAWGKCRPLDLTASRRLAIAAEASGVTTLLVRIDAAPEPSAARTRWEIAAAPSVALEADAPGHPAFTLRLLRHPAGLSGLDWPVEWDRDRSQFREPAHPGAVVPLPLRGPMAEPWRRFG
jgi:protein ImuA